MAASTVSLLLFCLLIAESLFTSNALVTPHAPIIRQAICTKHNNQFSSNLIAATRWRRTQFGCWEKPNWLEDAMGDDFNDDEASSGSSERPVATLASGLSGFCLDDKLGFVAILSAEDKFLATTVSLRDRGRDRLVSPEALTMVQLAGGMDLGMAVLPPDALMQMVLSEITESDDDEGAAFDKNSLPLVSLTGVRAMPNEHYGSDRETKANAAPAPNADLMNSEARNKAIQQGLPQVSKAIQSLAGLQQVADEQVQAAMNIHANEQGTLDRQGFSNLLDQLRRGLATFISSSDKKVKFVLDVNVVRQDSIQNLSIETLDTFRALGLSMRHKIPLHIAPECLEDDKSTILEKFPAFRPLQELYEDAKLMDGVIPSLFENAKLKQQPPSPSDDS
jgi:hypothetical protein